MRRAPGDDRLLPRVVVGVIAVLCGAGVLAALSAHGHHGATPGALTETANTTQFRVGNIISDQLFFDGNAMDANAVQGFLDYQNPRCVAASDGTPCLRTYRTDTETKPADTRCRGTYQGASGEPAAVVIAKVGQVCGVSQRVLLVILQKEQGLVTASGNTLTARRYREAMGFACSDSAPCKPAYNGFFNQVYTAAWQYQNYAANPAGYNTKVGVWNNIRYDVEESCGSSPVFVENQATAGLYNYTPYQPNAASLAAGKGTGDSCSAYGNRNFWIYFTDWFGSTQVPGASEVTGRYAQTGGVTGPLGAIQDPVACGLVNGGCLQAYANGAIYWSPAGGARVVMKGAVRDKWASFNWENGALGYPVGDTVCGLRAGGCFQAFQNGSVYWTSATGAHTVAGAIRDKWGSMGWEGGPLGYPLIDQSVTPDGKAQYLHFQSGSVYWSPTTGAHVLGGVVRDKWAQGGWENGALGLPVSDGAVTPDGSGQFAHFQSGSIYWSNATGAHYLLTALRDGWATTGWENGRLGYPTSDQAASPGGRGQAVAFQRGWLYWSPATGAHQLDGVVRDAWLAVGADGGSLGLPVSDVLTTPDGMARAAHFQGGSLYVHAQLGAHVLPTAIRDAWAASGWESGPLGYPTSDVAATGDGRGTVMSFQGGKAFASPGTGGHAVPAAVLTAYEAAGGPSGALGFPTSDAATTPDGRARFQHFEQGSLYSTSAGTFTVPAEVRSVWSRTGWETGPLGYPTSAPTADGGSSSVTRQEFQGGTVYSGPAGGWWVSKVFQEVLTRVGGTTVLGAPVSDARTTAAGTGTTQTFQNGAIWASPGTGARAVSREIGAAWAARGGEAGPLGYPITDVTSISGGAGRFVHFQGGSVYWSQGTGAHVLRGAIRDAWAAQGWENGALGYPTTDVVVLPDGKGQGAQFARGAIYWTQATGAHTMSREVVSAWAAQGWETGPLGYPITDVTSISGGAGRFVHFQGGSVYWSQGTGAHVLRGAIRDAWAAQGWENGALGYPTTDVLPTADGLGLHAAFQSGEVWWTPATGARVLRGAVLDAWVADGRETGAIGYPVSDTRSVADGTRTDFQRGWISVSAATGEATVHAG